MRMDEEFIDEARKCPQCGVVTYCERCPICGKKLARTARGVLRFRNKTAGDDEDVMQQTNRIIGNQHIKERPMKKNPHPYEEADHVEPEVNFHQDEGTRRNGLYKEDYLREKKGNKIILLVAFVVLITSMAGLMLSAMGQGEEEKPAPSETTQPWEEGTQYTLEQRSIMSGNQGDIQVDSYHFDEYTETGYVSITNYGERAFHGNFVLFENDKMVSSFDDLYILPYESFELSMYTDKPAEEYEMQNYQFYEITSKHPDFSFYTYNDFGNVEVESYDEIDDEQLEVLLNYLQEAMSYGDDDFSSLTLYLPSGNLYEAYIYSDGEATVYYENDDYEVIRSYDLKLQNSTTSKGISL